MLDVLSYLYLQVWFVGLDDQSPLHNMDIEYHNQRKDGCFYNPE